MSPIRIQLRLNSFRVSIHYLNPCWFVSFHSTKNLKGELKAIFPDPDPGYYIFCFIDTPLYSLLISAFTILQRLKFSYWIFSVEYILSYELWCTIIHVLSSYKGITFMQHRWEQAILLTTALSLHYTWLRLYLVHP